MLRPGRPAAHDKYPLTCELLRPRIVRGVQLAAPERFLPGIARPEGPVPGAGRVDQRPRRPVSAGRPHEQPPAVALPHLRDVHRPVNAQVEGALVRGEVLPDHLGRGPRTIGPGQLHTGQGVHPVHFPVRERGPPKLPGAAGVRRVVQHDEAGAGLVAGSAEVVGAGQAGLAGADDYDVYLVGPEVVHGSTNGGGGRFLPGVFIRGLARRSNLFAHVEAG